MTTKFSRYSFSSVSKYLECGRYFKLYYLDKWRSPVEASALTFGVAVDKSFEVMMQLGYAKSIEMFLSLWTEDKVLTGNEEFTKSDYEEGLMKPEEMDLPQNMKTFLSLKRKGIILLDSLNKNLIPQIEKVYSTQEQIKLVNSNDSGDEFIGLVDFVVKLKGIDKPIIGDLKTTSVRYEADSVVNSPQLTMYTHALSDKYNTRLAGFFVVNKKLIKEKICASCNIDHSGKSSKFCRKCGEELPVVFVAKYEQIISEIPTENEDKVLESVDTAYHSIKAEVFEPNERYCIHPLYRRKCIFYDFCHNNDTTGLTRKESK